MEAGFAIVPKTDCPHLDNVSALQSSSIQKGCPCSVCESTEENWVCLTCHNVFCSRYVQGHMHQHWTETSAHLVQDDSASNPSPSASSTDDSAVPHHVAFSLRDFSSWCFACDSYIDTPKTRQANIALSISYFGADSDATHAAYAYAKASISSSGRSSTDSAIFVSLPHDALSPSNESLPSATSTSASSASSIDVISESLTQVSISDTSNKDSSHDEKESSPSVCCLYPALAASSTPKAKAPSAPFVSYDIAGVAHAIKHSKRIIVMCGAGISVSCGIPDFRSPKTGLYANLQKFDLPYPEAVFELDFFEDNPKPFCTLAKELFPGSFLPSPTHHFIKLLADQGKLVRCFTQNIDALERATGLNGDLIFEAHGSFHSSRCIKCKEEHSTEFVKTTLLADAIPRCKSCNGLVKPDIVFFGESLPSDFFRLSQADFPSADLLLVLGTSLKVHPFAGLIHRVSKNCPRVLINRELAGVNELSSEYGFRFDLAKSRDAFLPGNCDDTIWALAEALNSKSTLEEMIAKCKL